VSVIPGQTYRLTAAASFPGLLVTAQRQECAGGCMGWMFAFQAPRHLAGLFIEDRHLAACLEAA
jgi:hypothetical protein